MNTFEKFGIAIGLSLIITCLFEIYFIYTLYINADYVKCNWLWCDFVTQTGEIIINQTMTKTCYLDGVQVNCSELKDAGATDGWRT
jgi:hypothetical protein